MNSRFLSRLLAALLCIGIFTTTNGCRRHDHTDHDHSAHDHGEHAGHDHSHGGHSHVAPHGGTAIVLGDELFHLELVLDAEQGLLTAYTLDGEMENFIRLPLPEIKLMIEDPALGEVSLQAVANTATGETVGDTSQFEVKADWLRNTPRFRGEIPALEIKGRRFEKVAFRFPEGNH